MPRGKGYRKKRVVRRRRRKVVKRTPLPIGGFPASKLVKLRYVQEVEMSTTGLSTSQPFDRD